jgi:hypothetical protein
LIYKIFDNAVLEQYKIKFNNILSEYRRKNYNEIKESLDLMNWLYNNGELNETKGFLRWIKSSGTFKKILLNDINKYKESIKTVCDDYFLNYNKVIEYYEYLINVSINIITADIEYDADYKKINPFVEVKNINPYLLKVVNSSIEDKLNYAVFISQPLFFSVMFENGYKTLSTRDCSIKPLFGKELNTLCTNIGSYIGYYTIKNDLMSIIYNINISKITNYNPYYYNPSNIKSLIVIKEENVSIIRLYNSNEWNRLIMIVNNTFSNLSFDIFPLNNPNYPIIQEYSKQIK